MTRSKPKTKVLFVCVGNMCRSPMAEGFALKYGSDILEVYSAGTHATGTVSEDSIEIMRELKIDISKATSNGLDAVPVGEMDIVVSMAPMRARDMVPRGFRGQTIDWKVEDPVGKSLAVFLRSRDQINVLVRQLVDAIRRERDHSA
ncbi:MAG TPA: arsenate reductase ArsC [Candidatus Krumholzibacteria bacterium]|nr:arsenate reductase ArsC [Candidatus Krumholzibacteria bacterium]